MSEKSASETVTVGEELVIVLDEALLEKISGRTIRVKLSAIGRNSADKTVLFVEEATQ